MYTDWTINLTVVAATLGATAACVLTHYEGLSLASRGLSRLPGAHRRVKVLYAITSVLLLHVMEIWIFALVLWGLLQWPGCGSVGPAGQGLLDIVYFSSVTYTTVGYGDLAPSGPVRFLAGTESLAGFVLLTWSASFTFLEMERFWRPG